MSGAAPLRLGFLTANDPRDRKSFSGTHFRMLSALEQVVDEVVVLGPFPSKERCKVAFRQVNRFVALATRKRFHFEASIAWSLACRGHFRDAVRAAAPLDMIFAPAAAPEVALLDTAVPIFYASDATYRLLQGYYRNFSSFLGLSTRHAISVEGRAMRKASLLTYSSNWAADSAVADYGVEPRRVHVVPYGANLDQAPPVELAENRAMRAGSGRLELLFLGVEWERKGGEIAFRALEALADQGVDVRLRVVGCVPPEGFRHDRMEVIPRLDKNDPVQRARLESILSETAFLIVPTRADCTPIAFCEAAAYGIPVLTTRTGGVPSVVVHGLTGVCLDLSDPGAAYARAARDLWEDPARYAAMAIDSRRRHDEVLNWDSWAESIRRVASEHVSGVARS